MSSAVLRLTKEYRNLQARKSLENFIALPEENNIFNWHFLIFGLKDCDYVGGYYHGIIRFPSEYPMKPPSLMMFTKNGRFEVNR